MVESECTTEDCVTAFLTKYVGELPIHHRRFSERLVATSEPVLLCLCYAYIYTFVSSKNFRSVHFQTLVVR
jgi:hypothetical protein